MPLITLLSFFLSLNHALQIRVKLGGGRSVRKSEFDPVSRIVYRSLFEASNDFSEMWIYTSRRSEMGIVPCQLSCADVL